MLDRNGRDLDIKPGDPEIWLNKDDGHEYPLIWVKCCQWWQVSAGSNWGHCGFCGEKPGHNGPLTDDETEYDTIKQIVEVYE